jgi:hypothetical protein
MSATCGNPSRELEALHSRRRILLQLASRTSDDDLLDELLEELSDVSERLGHKLASDGQYEEAVDFLNAALREMCDRYGEQVRRIFCANASRETMPAPGTA